ncbi:hypothetical protein BJ165DRAFT_1522474 [Panaeolus papilionaceus]|nr:hypothetical protein BJ165DRAFT_1522474 [Panaeolus papilionaceus]
MSATTVTLPANIEYVGAALLSTSILLFGQNIVVSRYRKAAGIKYPQMYAEKAEADASPAAYQFNCAQRAHQNTLENIPILYVTTVLTAVRYPVLAAITCAMFTIGRISYTRGYITGDPAKRTGGLYLVGALGMVGQLLASSYIAGGWLYNGIISNLF